MYINYHHSVNGSFRSLETRSNNSLLMTVICVLTEEFYQVTLSDFKFKSFIVTALNYFCVFLLMVYQSMRHIWLSRPSFPVTRDPCSRVYFTFYRCDCREMSQYSISFFSSSLSGHPCYKVNGVRPKITHFYQQLLISDRSIPPPAQSEGTTGRLLTTDGAAERAAPALFVFQRTCFSV
ncbi:hypothetical protein fugu_003508 [Takifugu bimaculatus]|uniref:Uncharacterized protein n=1 Tax=Takifugu bimaculatus TaxID=433685 RepID=A0A4Z2BGT6_9TELE|nr:hypothetical protein fugu_003508 [Takifugu bimaculatus]